MKKKAIEIKIFGRVQGVFFRITAKRQAEALGLTGWIKNLSDGSVLVWAEGKKENLQIFLKWCYNGPGGAKIERINFTFKTPLFKFRGFEVIN